MLRHVRDMREAVYDSAPRTVRFSLEVVVTCSSHAFANVFAATDDRDHIVLSGDRCESEPRLAPGDRIRVSGLIARNPLGYNVANTLSTEILSHGPPPPPDCVAIADLNRDDLCDHVVRFEGTVFDVFRDDTDLRFVFFIVAAGDNEIAYVPVALPKPGNDNDLARFVDAHIAVTGLCVRDRKGNTKRKLGANLSHITLENIRVLAPPPSDPYNVPELSGSIRDILSPSPGESRRRKARGEVVAAWHGDRFLIRRPEGEISKVVLLDGIVPPRAGDFVEAVGAPDSDLYSLNLSRARWRAAQGGQARPKPVRDWTLKDLLTDGAGHPQVNMHQHGRILRLKGVVAETAGDFGNGTSRFTLLDDGLSLPVDVSAAPEALADIRPGARVEATGACVMEIDNWRPQVPFPKVNGCLLVVRGAGDVRVIARPPWWTTTRLLSALGLMIVVLLAFFVWNRNLNRLVERRGHELLREQIGRAHANLKTEERTHLAVELHDSLAQSLTGASMEIEASLALRGNASDEMMRHLDIADKTLKSCRDDLRNCLWDLRSRALEEKSMDMAIRRTLSPHVNSAKLSLRFAVPRSRLSENTAHAVLRIIRELVLNAIRHGRAAVVLIAGSLDGNRLLFSVSDNGCGFDPDTRPGVPQGHFGLAGIEERVVQLNGTTDIRSAPGRGTRVRISIPLPDTEEVGLP